MIVIALGLLAAALALAAALTDSIGLAVAAAAVTGLGAAFWGLDLAAARRQRPLLNDASETAGPVQAGGLTEPSGVVYVIPGRTRFHRAGCSSIADRELDELPRQEAEGAGLLPCGRCAPRP